MLNRIKIIQQLINATGARNYLEIGVNNGACFLRLRARCKIAVDPSFKIATGRKLKYFVKNPWNFNNRYFEQTSDDFFSSQGEMLATNRPQLVLIDGLHTYEQALRDVINSLSFLDRNGIIVMHDCNPLTEQAGLPASSIDHIKKTLSEYRGVWNGDVWKAIVHLRSMHTDLEVFVLDCDHGIGVVRRGTAGKKLSFAEDEIRNLTYRDLEKNREEFLNLKPAAFFEEFVRDHAKSALVERG